MQRIFDRRVAAEFDVVRKPVESGLGSEADELGAGNRGVTLDRGDHCGQWGGAMVLDVRGHLGQTMLIEPQADGAQARMPLLAALANQRGDPPGVVERRRRRELDVERHQRRPSGDEDRTGGRVQPRRPEVRRELTGGDPPRQLRRTAAAKLGPGAPHEVLLVMDATTGQNGLQQARLFTQSAGVTGIVLTKLDGTAKGGIAVAIARELNLPVRFVGVGEKMEDLLEFDAGAFVDALVG